MNSKGITEYIDKHPLSYHHNCDTAVPAADFHFHQIYEIYLCRTEGMRYLVGKNIYHPQKGDILIFNNFDVHRPLPPEDRPYERIMVLFHPEIIRLWEREDSDLLMCFKDHHIGFNHLRHLSADGETEFMTLFQEGKQLADKEGYGRDIERKVILTRILLLINRIFQENSPREIPFPASTDQLKRILDYIDDHLAEALSLSHLSGTFGTTPNSLNRLFRKGLSMTVHQYILHRRIEYARLYLMEGRPVTDTARDAGFGDLTNFIRVFKRKTGMTPGTFRKR